MKHVPFTILHRIRWLFVAYGLQFIVGYLVAVFVLHDGLRGNATFNPLVASLAAVQLLYELFARLYLDRRRPWIASVISFVAILLVNTIALEYTGVYHSPYALGIIVLTFLAGAFSQYLPYVVSTLYLIGFMFSLAGVFKSNDGGHVAGLLFMCVDVVTVALSYLVWRRRYGSEASPEMARLSQSLRTSQTQSNIIINTIDDGVVVVDQHGTIQLFNPGAVTISGWKSEEAVGLDWKLVFKFVDSKGQPVPDDQTGFVAVTQSGTAHHDHNANLLTKSGKTIALDIGISPLLDESQHVTGLVGIFRDISQQRQEENQRAEFISTASHEMRTPVAAIEGYLSLALNDKVAKIDNKARDYLEKAHASTQHLGQLFQDLLTSAKAEDGRLTNHPQIVEMGAYLEQLVQDLKFSAEKKGLFMDFTFGAASHSVDATNKLVRPLYYVHVDPDRLREVITNIFDNAVKYTDKGTINIGLTGNETVVQFYVRDTGPGIPAEDIPHLFQKFYRVDSSATRTIGGTGLGLFICRKIVELYQGRVWAESEVGKGTTFFINLPRVSSERATQLQASESQSSTLPPIASATGL